MGWTYHSDKAGDFSALRDYLLQPCEGQICITSEASEARIWSVWETDTGVRFVCLFLLDLPRGGFKALDETTGPFYYDCPLAFLELAPIPLGRYSDIWREKVRAFHAEIAVFSARVAAL